MRIALLTAEYPPQPGGVGDYTRCLGQALVSRGHDLRVLTIRDAHCMLLPVDGAAPSWVGAPALPGWGWRSWRAIIAALAAMRPDWLHIQYQTGAYGMHPAINLLPWRLRTLPGRPRIVVTFHDLRVPYLFPKAGPLRHYVTRRLAYDPDRVIVTNAEDAARLTGFCAPTIIPIGSNIPVAPPPGYARDDWRAALGIGPHDFLVAYFGLLSPSKGIDRLLDAIYAAGTSTMCATPPRLLLIGGAATAPQDRAYAAAVSAQIARLALRNQVIQTGQVDAATVSAHLLAADCVALPFSDGASFRRGSLLAAMTHGAAIITTQPVPAATHASIRLVHGENVLFVPPNDHVALAAALQQVADDQPLRIRLGTAAKKLAASFTWEAIAHQHERLYADTVRSP